MSRMRHHTSMLLPRVPRALALTVAGALGLGALTGCAPAASDRPLIVVTTNILGDVVQNIAGDQAEVLTLMRPEDRKSVV